MDGARVVGAQAFAVEGAVVVDEPGGASAGEPMKDTVGQGAPGDRWERVVADQGGEELEIGVLIGPPGDAVFGVTDGSEDRDAGGVGGGVVGGGPGGAAGGGEVVVDTLVGQVNGRPIYADEFFGAPGYGQRMRELALRSRDLESWQREAVQLIARDLRDLIDNELVLREAERPFTEPDSPGLLFVFDRIQEAIVRRTGGSELEADERTRETAGVGLYESARDFARRELVRAHVESVVGPRVNVTRRHVEQAYERNIEQFRPPATAVFRIIRLDASDEAGRAEVARRLAEGEAFASVADDESLNPYPASRQERVIAGEYGDEAMFARGSWNAAAAGLEAGEWAGPIETEEHVAWIQLESLEREEGVSLYEAQLRIERGEELRMRTRESEKYLRRLRERGSISDEREMLLRLLDFATERYYEQARGGP